MSGDGLKKLTYSVWKLNSFTEKSSTLYKYQECWTLIVAVVLNSTIYCRLGALTTWARLTMNSQIERKRVESGRILAIWRNKWPSCTDQWVVNGKIFHRKWLRKKTSWVVSWEIGLWREWVGRSSKRRTIWWSEWRWLTTARKSRFSILESFICRSSWERRWRGRAIWLLFRRDWIDTCR